MGDFGFVSTASLLKYQALGNDFLIALDPAALGGREAVGKETVRYLCDRRRGVGADGLILVHPAKRAGEAAMELRNADGGRAETSGNGLRCLALALLDAGLVSSPSFLIETDGGEVRLEVAGRRAGRSAEVRASMGRVSLERMEPSPLEGFSAYSVDVSNPHLVLLGEEIETVDLSREGPRLETSLPGGRNVEVVRKSGQDALELAVWERGAGLTAACGSGSVAAAAAARSAGLVGDRVVVDNPGGRLVVELAGEPESPEATLPGPACRVARLEVELGPVAAES